MGPIKYYDRLYTYFCEGIVLTESISALVPAYNLQASLASVVTDLLEVLPEMSPRFEILVIDDGSSDATAEIAHELTCRYPQLRLLSHATRLGRHGTMRTGLSRARGEMLLWREPACELQLRDVYKLWQARGSFDAVLATSSARSQPAWGSWAQRVLWWSQRDSQERIQTTEAPGYSLMRRSVAESLQKSGGSRRDMLTELARGGFSWVEVEVRSSRPQMPESAASEQWQRLRLDQQSTQPEPASATPHSSRWSQIKAFAKREA